MSICGTTPSYEAGPFALDSEHPRVLEGVNDLEVRKKSMADDSIEIAGGFGSLAGKVLLIGTMGHGSSPENVDLLLKALKSALDSPSRLVW